MIFTLSGLCPHFQVENLKNKKLYFYIIKYECFLFLFFLPNINCFVFTFLIHDLQFLFNEKAIQYLCSTDTRP